MLHLSLVHLPRDRPIDLYQAHQLVWKAFPNSREGERPFLFSLDQRPSHHSILVQSTEAPAWDFLNDRGRVQTKTFDPRRIVTGSALRFFLRANPTVDRKGFRDGKKRRVAVGINPQLTFEQMGRPDDAPNTPDEVAVWRRAQLLDWLDRKAEAGGFEVESAEPGPIVARKVVRSVRGRERPMTFHEVEFTGTLRVNGSEAFTRTLAAGIGRARAFGYGLLMVRPA